MTKIAKALDSFLCTAFEVLEKNIFLKLLAMLYIILAVSPFLILFLPIYIFKKIRGKSAMFKVYISGAIKNNPNFREEFEMAEKNLRDKGFIPLNPCKTKAHLSGASEKECLFEAIALMREANIIVQISPIEISEGMRIEQDVAKYSKIPIQNWILANKACTAEDIKKIADALIAKKERENIANQRDRILADVHICFWTDPAVMKAIAREIANKIKE